MDIAEDHDDDDDDHDDDDDDDEIDDGSRWANGTWGTLSQYNHR